MEETASLEGELRDRLRRRVLLLVGIFVSVALVDELIDHADAGSLALLLLAEGLLPWIGFAVLPTLFAFRLIDRLVASLGAHERARGELDDLASALSSSGLLLALRSSGTEPYRIEWVNRAFERHTGRYAETLIGRLYREIDPEHLRRIEQTTEARGLPATPLTGESSFARHDGTRLPVRYELIRPSSDGAHYTFAIDRSGEIALEGRLARLTRAEGVLEETRAALVTIEGQVALALGGEIDGELRADLEAIVETARQAGSLLA